MNSLKRILMTHQGFIVVQFGRLIKRLITTSLQQITHLWVCASVPSEPLLGWVDVRPGVGLSGPLTFRNVDRREDVRAVVKQAILWAVSGFEEVCIFWVVRQVEVRGGKAIGGGTVRLVILAVSGVLNKSLNLRTFEQNLITVKHMFSTMTQITLRNGTFNVVFLDFEDSNQNSII